MDKEERKKKSYFFKLSFIIIRFVVKCEKMIVVIFVCFLVDFKGYTEKHTA